MLREALVGMAMFVGYYILAASLIVVVKVCLKPPAEWVRKLLHSVCFLSVFVLLYAFKTWYLAVFAALAFALIVYPVITLIEQYPKLMGIFQQRKSGEIKTSLMLVFLMMAALITIFWGLLGEQWKYIIAVSIMAWGFGDAAAALVGKSLGRRQIRSRLVDGKKTVEGSFAMYAVSALAILATLLAYASAPWYLCLATALLVAPICALVELVSHHGMDTVTVPFAAAVPVYTLMSLFTYMGV